MIYFLSVIAFLIVAKVLGNTPSSRPTYNNVNVYDDDDHLTHDCN